MKTVLLICILVALTLPSAFAAPEWKPYDDFEGDLDAIDETPGQIPDQGVFGSGSVGQLGGWQAFAYEDIPENTNMLRTIRLEWNDAKHEMAVTVDPGEKTEWKKDDIPSNADLGKFPWWSIYLTADQVVEVAVDDVFVKSESLPYPVEARGKLASRWGEIKQAD